MAAAAAAASEHLYNGIDLFKRPSSVSNKYSMHS